jgi:hypothetical protein
VVQSVPAHAVMASDVECEQRRRSIPSIAATQAIEAPPSASFENVVDTDDSVDSCGRWRD